MSDTHAPTPPPATSQTEPAAQPPRWHAIAIVVAITAWPFLSLMAANTDEPLDLGVIATWWLLTLAPALALTLFGLRISPRTGRWVAAWCALAVWMVYSFELISDLGARVGWTGTPLRWWVAMAVGGLLLGAVATRAAAVQQFVLLVAGVFAVTALGQLVIGVATDGGGRETPPPATATFEHRPDVWFIALDGLASNDFMRERTAYDASAFAQALEADGVEIQQHATSNYPLTHLSISSTMMMEYGSDEFEEPKKQIFFDRMQGQSAVVDLFMANGYSYAHAYPGYWTGSKCSGREDICFGDGAAVTDTEAILRQIVPFGGALEAPSQHVEIANNNDPARAVSRVIAADLPHPRFSFVHMLNPHAPLLRDAACNVRDDISLRFSLWGDGPEYADAVRCLHAQLEDAVDQILTVDDDPIIVIQGDHGPRLGIDWDVPDGVVLGDEMHFSILSAIRLPQVCDSIEVPSDLTPVNTFRIVKACLEGTTPDLLGNIRYPIHAERG